MFHKLFIQNTLPGLVTSRCSALNMVSTRSSSFGPQFIDPIFKHEDIDRIVANGELKNYKDIPIKPPTSFQTCSTFYSPVKEKFINYMMDKGKKKLARDVFEYTIKAIKIIQIEKYNKATSEEERQHIILDPYVIIDKAIENTKPMLKLRAIKRAAITYQVPIPISDKEATAKAMKWHVEIADDKPSKVHFSDNLAQILIDGSENKGKVVKRKTDLHRTCEANRAYAHYYFG
uniref:28S ribosomal protein S7, mitochondrial n=1 Tax=Cacopsylla melanoneura TaxID=428564 RepID=A0A8D9AXE8_9HEMI